MDLHFYAVDRPSWAFKSSAVFTHRVFKSELIRLKVHSEVYVQNVCISKWEWQHNIKSNTFQAALSESSDINLPILGQLPLDTLSISPPHYKVSRK
jgi:hypothetical protein